MSDDKLSAYRGKRSAARTPEPVPAEGPLPQGNDDTFVIQEHHARALHWDFRLERDGVLVSWAIPKGLPLDPKSNRLAVRTEDHPLEYAAFEDEIPAGEYGGGVVRIWDRGTYACEKWSDREVMVVLDGQRAKGRYVLFRTGGRRGDTDANTGGSGDTSGGPSGDKGWMIHRMDPAPDGWQALPELVRPMLATTGALPTEPDEARWAYEMKWDGIRAVLYVEGGRVRAMTRNDRDVIASYPELRELGLALGSTQAVLDGEIVALDDDTGRVSFGALQRRMHVQDAARVRRLAEKVPVTYVAFDLLHLDGRDTTGLPYEQRRELLDGLGLRGAHWTTPPHFAGDGADVLAASEDQGLEGIVGKRLASVYEPGRRSRSWVKIKNARTQTVVIGGWRPGQGHREATIGSLLMGIPGPDGLEYVGHVGSGFTDEMLADLTRRLGALEQETTPFAGVLPAAVRKDARWTAPTLVGEAQFGEWTRDGRLRHPTWRGLRPDREPADVTREA